ncbi:hypothetical protein BKA70DRAFT_1278217 [Coprinopsis sp. MPI-PUGE-AT-0042]|nr:hypothetical protein BKA70DRAFT_1278217 [Coprinopsis sp. MPI-PUGE-AT-0042]
MDMGGESDTSSNRGRPITRDVKGKGKAVEPVVEVPTTDGGAAERRERREKERERRRKAKSRREPVYSLRPILTIHKSQGFVWNQDLFVPPYIKDRYIASTSPPNSKGFISTSASSTNTTMSSSEYEAVEVVEIRIREGEFREIIPS